ncbi:unnamed protein product [Eruca vesicaria subsp. sativa]|uniref:Replication factor A C-terminal domain-containing protein n=1 Tax=Eruca vesicaria subsp. sativa TaxID=29727 RepID=A0ABC8KVG3_ERUVS|nr:unnamed protein product [Eruca vesicaria subsp. sativa]
MTVLLSDLQAGRSSSTVQVRLLRFWEARNFRRGGELMGVDMLLLDSQAVDIHKQLESMVVDPRVIVATSVNPKMVGGRLFLNATSGTHIYFDKETSAGEQLFYRLGEQETGLKPVTTLLKSYSKVEKISISELNDFVLTAASQEADFICAGTVTGVKFDKGWCYVSCSKCFKKLQRSDSSLTCLPCNNTNAVGVLRYRVEMTIADNTGEGLFVGFDGVGGGDITEESEFPQFVKDMVGKSFTFQVKSADGGKDNAGDGTGCVSSEMEVGGGSKSGGSATVSGPVKKARTV